MQQPSSASSPAAGTNPNHDDDDSTNDHNKANNNSSKNNNDGDCGGESPIDADQFALKELLAALAQAVRAANPLPDDDNDDTNNRNGSSEWAFEASFPEFAMARTQAQLMVFEIVRDVLMLQRNILTSSHHHTYNPAVKAAGVTAAEDEFYSDLQDPLLWEECADVCDTLLEQVEQYVQQTTSESATTAGAVASTASLRQFSQYARQRSVNNYHRIVAATINDMEKPQVTYRISPPVPNNSRTAVFVPSVHPSKPHAVVPVVDYHDSTHWCPGHGYDTRLSPLRPAGAAAVVASRVSPALIAPSHHVPHPYRAEIEQFQYRPEQLQSPFSAAAAAAGQPPPAPPPTLQPYHTDDGNSLTLTAQWIDSVEDLHTWSRALQQDARINNMMIEMAIDLEAHSHRSFAGLVCLMQVSVRKTRLNDQGNNSVATTNEQQQQHVLIDTLRLHNHINAALADLLANPAIVKVLHGADSDIAWLQRDFGLYIVNMFDTGRAARALMRIASTAATAADLPSSSSMVTSLPRAASLAHLLQHYVPGLNVDKTLQLADWRQRPLSTEMKHYAIQDTAYLLDLYDRLRHDLDVYGDCTDPENNNNDSIRAVFDVSRNVCLIRYAPEPFDPEGYCKFVRSSISLSSSLSLQQQLGRGGGRHHHQQQRRRRQQHTELNMTQEAVLRAVWDWRDAIARQYDESVLYVCNQTALMRMALSCPRTVSALVALFQPVPELWQRNPDVITQLIRVIQQAIHQAHEEEEMEPANQETETPHQDASSAITELGPSQEQADNANEVENELIAQQQQPQEGGDEDDLEEDYDDEYDEEEDGDEDDDEDGDGDDDNEVDYGGDENVDDPEEVDAEVELVHQRRHQQHPQQPQQQQQQQLKVGAPSSAFFKPASANDKDHPIRSSMMSPVLGTEALYKQAGWMTPLPDPHQPQQEDHAKDFRATAGSVDRVQSGGIIDLEDDDDDDDDDGGAGLGDLLTTEEDDDPDERTTGVTSGSGHSKPKHYLAVHASNQQYRSKQTTDHSIEFGANPAGSTTTTTTTTTTAPAPGTAIPLAFTRGRSVDGMGTARAACDSSYQLLPVPAGAAVKEASQFAQQMASHIKSSIITGVGGRRSSQSNNNKKEVSTAAPSIAMLGVMSPTTANVEKNDYPHVQQGGEASPTTIVTAAAAGKEGTTNNDKTAISADTRTVLTSAVMGSAVADPSEGSGGGDCTDAEFVVPRSMREIYKISNRNRRYKKTGSPTPERGVTPTNEKEREELARAEALLRERGLATAGYFSDPQQQQPGSPGKRQRLKSTGRESEESIPQESLSSSNHNNNNGASKDGDLAFMKEIGWIDGEGDLMNQRYGRTSSMTSESNKCTLMTGGDDATDEQQYRQQQVASGRDDANLPPPSGAFPSSSLSFDYSGVVPILGGIPPSSGQQQQQTATMNPFFAGAALTGGPLAQGFGRTDSSGQGPSPSQRPRKGGGGGKGGAGGGGRRNNKERPDRGGGGSRSLAYRKR